MKEKYTAKRFFRRLWRKEKLMLFILLGVLIGLLVGALTNPYIVELPEPSRTDARIGAQFIGDMFLQCLRLIVLPLIISSLIRGMSGLDSSSAGKLGLSAFVYYISTTIISVIVAIVLAVTIQPGNRATYNIVTDNTITESRTLDLFLDIIRNVFPDNIVQACFQTVKTTSKEHVLYENPQPFQLHPSFPLWSEEIQNSYIQEFNIFNITENEDGSLSAYNATIRKVLLPDATVFNNGMNMLGVITFCIIFGVFLGRIKHGKESMVEFLGAIEMVTIKMITLVMWTSPVGICSLIIGQFWKIDNINSAFASLALYVVTVFVGELFQFFVILFILYFVITRKNPFIFLKHMLKAAFTAFGCASSSATIPVTLECLDENAKIDKRISSFMIPVGATVNMNGTAIYETIAALFIAQVYGLNLTFGRILIIGITAAVTSVGAAGIPGGALVTLVIVLQAIGLPPEALGLIVSMDWILDRITTMLNVLGDAYGCAIVQYISKKYFPLKELETTSPSSSEFPGSNESENTESCPAKEFPNGKEAV